MFKIETKRMSMDDIRKALLTIFNHIRVKGEICYHYKEDEKDISEATLSVGAVLDKIEDTFNIVNEDWWIRMHHYDFTNVGANIVTKQYEIDMHLQDTNSVHSIMRIEVETELPRARP